MNEVKREAVAAISGVMAYLRGEGEKKPEKRLPPPMTTLSPWALYGRQSIMYMRTLVQRRVLKR